MIKERINLTGRNGEYTATLIHIKETSYKFIALNDYPYSVGYEKDNSITYLDPSDGPLIGIGSIIEGMEISSIISTNEGIIINFK